MKIHFSCPFCDRSYSVDSTMAGRKGRCKECGATMQVPGTAAKPRSAPPAGDVDDPYGLVDEAPATIRSDMLAEAEDSASPLRRAGASSPGAGTKKKKKRGRDDGPWGMPIRRAAIGMMVVVLALGRRMEYVRKAHQEDAVGSLVQTGMLILVLLTAALSIVSVVGAIVSFARGNRSAFRGEGVGGQIGWILTVLVSVLLGSFYFYSNNAGGFGLGRTPLGSLDAGLSTTERAPLVVYEDLMKATMEHHRRFAAALDRLGTTDFGGSFDVAVELQSIDGDAGMLRFRGRTTPAPTREQVERLFAQFAGPYREAITNAARATREAKTRVSAPPGSPGARAMEELDRRTETYANDYARAFPEGSTNATGWYFLIFGKDAGSAVPDPSAMIQAPPAPTPTPAPTPAPTPPPTEVAPPPAAPTPTQPDGGLTPEMQRELERFQRETGAP